MFGKRAILLKTPQERIFKSSIIKNPQKVHQEEKLNEYLMKNFTSQKQVLILNFSTHDFDSKINGIVRKIN